MGMNLGNNKNGPMSDINVTPFVDVVLVLLVIFMITAPLMLNGIKLELPKTKEVNKMNITASQVVMSFTKTNEVFIGKEKFLKKELIPKILSEFNVLLSIFTVKYIPTVWYARHGLILMRTAIHY